MNTVSQITRSEILDRPVRSGFLTALCILTFIGSGYGIVSSIGGFIMADKITTEMKKEDVTKNRKKLEAKKDRDSQFELKMMNSFEDFTDAGNMKKFLIVQIGSNLLTLLGAVLMIRQRRLGYYIYITGIVAGVALPLAIFGTNNILAMLSVFVPAFFGLVFIVMYGLCLKEME